MSYLVEKFNELFDELFFVGDWCGCGGLHYLDAQLCIFHLTTTFNLSGLTALLVKKKRTVLAAI